MSDDAPSLSDYEEIAGEDLEISEEVRESINEEISDLFDG